MKQIKIADVLGWGGEGGWGVDGVCRFKMNEMPHSRASRFRSQFKQFPCDELLKINFLVHLCFTMH